MSPRRLAVIVSSMLLLSHFGIVAWLFWLAEHGFGYPKVFESLQIIVPLFAAFTTAILRNAFGVVEPATPAGAPGSASGATLPAAPAPDSPAPPARGPGAVGVRKLGGIAVVAGVAIPSLYMILLVTLTSKAASGAMSFGDFKAGVAILETVFGIYVGLMIHRLLELARL